MMVTTNNQLEGNDARTSTARYDTRPVRVYHVKRDFINSITPSKLDASLVSDL